MVKLLLLLEQQDWGSRFVYFFITTTTFPTSDTAAWASFILYTSPHLVAKASCPLTLIWLRFWARAESVCFLRCFPYRLGPESCSSAWLVFLAWVRELRVILVTGSWEALSQLALDLFIPTPVSQKKKRLNPNEIIHCWENKASFS